MSRNRTALEKALGAPLTAFFALTLAYGFSACSGEGATLNPDPIDSSVDAGLNQPDGGGKGDAGSDATVPLGDASADASGDTGTDANPGGRPPIRIVAANLTSDRQTYLDPGIRVLKGLKPDIVMIQEFNVGSNSETDIRRFVDTAFGPDFTYFREVEQGDTIPNGVISRYPMQAEEWADDPENVPDRDFVRAKIDIPGDKDLWVISVHLKAGSNFSDETKRANQAKLLDDFIGKNIPATDYVVLGGDFNTSSRDGLLEGCIKTFSTKFVTSGPYPVDSQGNDKTNANRNRPYDWVLANPAMNALATAVRIGGQSFANGLVFDSRVYTPLTDVSPVQAEDSTPANTQHMAVVRDFRIP